MHGRIYACMGAFTHAWEHLRMHVCMAHTPLHAHIPPGPPSAPRKHTFLPHPTCCARRHTRRCPGIIYTCVCVCVGGWVGVGVCVYVNICVYIYICMYVYIYVYL